MTKAVCFFLGGFCIGLAIFWPIDLALRMALGVAGALLFIYSAIHTTQNRHD